MKTIKILKSICLLTLLILVVFLTSCNSSNQKQQNSDAMVKDTLQQSSVTDTTNKDVKKDAKVDKTKVPKKVNDFFIQEFPNAVTDNWYGLPVYKYGNDWFDDWYDYAPYVYSKYPENYIVEFSLDNMPHKAIYTKIGKKIAIHKKLASDLPKAISAAISKGQYKDWILAKDKEEIFKDKDSDKLKIYKVVVEKEKGKHTLFFEANGKLVKDKKVS